MRILSLLGLLSDSQYLACLRFRLRHRRTLGCLWFLAGLAVLTYAGLVLYFEVTVNVRRALVFEFQAEYLAGAIRGGSATIALCLGAVLCWRALPDRTASLVNVMSPACEAIERPKLETPPRATRRRNRLGFVSLGLILWACAAVLYVQASRREQAMYEVTDEAVAVSHYFHTAAFDGVHTCGLLLAVSGGLLSAGTRRLVTRDLPGERLLKLATERDQRVSGASMKEPAP